MGNAGCLSSPKAGFPDDDSDNFRSSDARPERNLNKYRKRSPLTRTQRDTYQDATLILDVDDSEESSTNGMSRSRMTDTPDTNTTCSRFSAFKKGRSSIPSLAESLKSETQWKLSGSQRKSSSSRKSSIEDTDDFCPTIQIPIADEPEGYINHGVGDLVLDRYRYVRQLETTHYGSVWEGFDEIEDQRVAVKQSDIKSARTNRKLKNEKHTPEDVELEIDIHSQLVSEADCPKAILDLYDVRLTDSSIYMIMEFGDGGSMFDIIKDTDRRHKSGWKKTTQRWFKDMVEATMYMHDRNICHKDMSLQNLLIRSKNESEDVKIIDFGLAERFTTDMCISRKKVGKANFASPECYHPKSKSFDAKANDVWTLGVILFTMLAGCAAYKHPLDVSARMLMRGERYIKKLLKKWKRDHMFTDDCVNLLSLIFQKEKDRISIQEVFAHSYCVEIIRQEQKKARELTLVSAGKYKSEDPPIFMGAYAVESCEEQDDIELSPKNAVDTHYEKKYEYPDYSKKPVREAGSNIRTAVC